MSELDFIVYGIILTIALIGTTEFVIELLHGIEVDTEDDELYDEACEEAAELLNSRKVQDKNDILNIFIKLFGKEKVKLVEDGSGDVEFENY